MKLRLRLNANHLKLIAITAMTIDHVSDLIYPGFPAEQGAMALHIVGRLAAPIMWFFVCEGYYYTHDVKRYLLRMGSFAVISHFAYCFAFGINPIPFSTGIFNQTTFDNNENLKKDLSDIKAGEAAVAGLSGWSMTCRDRVGTERSSSEHQCVVYNPKTGVVIFITISFYDDDTTHYDYMGDFQKMLDSAKLAP